MTDCTYRVSIKALITNEHGDFLLCKEDDGKWELPGGGIDHGETAEQCLHREIYEEMGLTVTYVSPTPKYFLSFQRQSGSWQCNVIYQVQVEHLDFTASDECREIGFFNAETIGNIDAFINARLFAEQHKNAQEFK
jgi:8-oxo-dGTP diphosphatase